jgi:predicted nucleic acid-binding protein
LRLLQNSVFESALQVQAEVSSLEVLMNRYRDTPISLADACLVRLSEIQRDCRLLTLDSHFRQYRRFGRQIVRLVAPR